MYRLENLRDNLCEELEKVSKKEQIGQSDLEIIYKLASSIKNLDKIMDESSYGSYGRSYDYSRHHDYSYARRGRDGDGDGRYSEGRSRDSYDYSRRMSRKFREMMNDTSNDREREAIRRCMEELERG